MAVLQYFWLCLMRRIRILSKCWKNKILVKLYVSFIKVDSFYFATDFRHLKRKLAIYLLLLQVDFSFYWSSCFLVSAFSARDEVRNTQKSMFTLAFHFSCILLDFINLNPWFIKTQVFLFINPICIQLSWYKGISSKPLENQLACEKLLISCLSRAILSKVYRSFVPYEMAHSTTLKYYRWILTSSDGAMLNSSCKLVNILFNFQWEGNVEADFRL